MDLETRLVDSAEEQSILIQVDYGEVVLMKSEDSRIHVQGQVLFADELEYQIDSSESQILIKVFAHHKHPSRVPLRVMIRLPSQRQVRVETDQASVLVRSFHGGLEIASTSGNITLEQITGEMTLRSNRGNITVQDSSGIVSTVGNYGALTAQNVRGDVSISTIMGNILFEGPIQRDDTVRLETDHGAISVKLGADSALTFQVRSTSGDVACMLPGAVSSTRTCEGQIDSGAGSLSVRTVSGAVTLQSSP